MKINESTSTLTLTATEMKYLESGKALGCEETGICAVIPALAFSDETSTEVCFMYDGEISECKAVVIES